MFVIEITPIGRGVLAESLSYFSHTAYPLGALLSIAVRKSTQLGVVTKITDAFSMKTALRAATFSLRKLDEQVPKHHLSPHIIETATKAAAFYAASMGSVLFSLIPKEIREGTIPFLEGTEHNDILPNTEKPYVFIAPAKERYREYRRMVRESFANKKSVHCVLPTLEYVSEVQDLLSTGIEAYTVLLHSGQPRSSFQKMYERLRNEGHPLLIITTPGHAFIDRKDIGTVIVEHARSNGYRAKIRPYIDYRFALEVHATAHRRTLIYADTVARSEEIYRLHNGSATSFGELPKRHSLPATLQVITMESEADPATFLLISPELKKHLELAVKNKERFFLYSARRGLAPLVACADCKHIFRDPHSGSPLALIRAAHHGEQKRFLVSSVSGYRMLAPDTCPTCGGWRLRERGIGIQHVYDELSKIIDPASIFLFDHITASTHKKAQKIRDSFYEKKGSILLGTALALPYIAHPVHHSAIMSMDSLRALPSWRQQEEVFALMMSLREKTMGSVFVQTRSEDDIFELVRRGELQEFYDQELKLREQFRYPPYDIFLHLTWYESENTTTTRDMLGQQFAPYAISLYSAPNVSAGKQLWYGLIRIPRSDWPLEELSQQLRTLPPTIRIMINPDRII